MHMSDALISPLIGGGMYLLSGGTSALGFKRYKLEEKPPLAVMGVMGAFVFSAQMLNFTIPMTGSSGHLTGGILLAAVLGPQAALVVMASILLIQSLFFGDGGLMAYGCNLLNMGVIPTLLVYGLMIKPLYDKLGSKIQLMPFIVFFAVISAELGAMSVVIQTMLSAKTGLSFGTFTLLMAGIHLPIGVVEGLITAAVLVYLKAYAPISGHLWSKPQSVKQNAQQKPLWLIGFMLVAALMGGLVSHYASGYDDGLEWSLAKSETAAESTDSGIAQWFAQLQEKTAILPDYGFKNGSESLARVGTSVSGLSGILLTFGVTTLAGLGLRARSKRLSATLKTEEE